MPKSEMPGGGVSLSGGGNGEGFMTLIERLRKAVDKSPPDVSAIREIVQALMNRWRIDGNRVVQVAGTGNLDEQRHLEAAAIFMILLKAFVILSLAGLAANHSSQSSDDHDLGEQADAIVETLLDLIRQAQPPHLMSTYELRKFVEEQVARLSVPERDQMRPSGLTGRSSKCRPV